MIINANDMKYIYLILAAMLLLCLAPMPYGYYMLVRYVAMVVEAVQTRFDAGYRSAYKASVDAMNGLTSALFTTTLVFMVFFIPVSFVSDTSGTFYKQFGLTMAVAVGISLLYALTLAPALCAMILKPRKE